MRDSTVRNSHTHSDRTMTEARLFGTVERRLFRTTAVLFATVALAVLIGGVLWVLAQALLFFSSLVLSLSVAGILALVLNPVVNLLERRLRLPRVAATSIIIVLFLSIIGVGVFLLLPVLSRQIVQFFDVAPGMIAGWQDYLSNRFPALTQILTESAEDGTLSELVPDIEDTGRTVRSYAGRLIALSFVPLFLFFALLSGSGLRRVAREILSVFSAGTQEKIIYFMDVFVGYVTAFFQGQLVIAVIMGSMLATGFTLIGLNGGIFIGLILGLLNIVPFLGTIVGLLIVLPIAYFQAGGGLQLLALSLLVFTVVQLVESWLLTPKIMANRTGLHPALVVISVFFWGTALNGIIGMILAVPLTAFGIAVWKQAKAGLTRSITAEEDEVRIQTIDEAGDAGSDEPADGPLVRQTTDKRFTGT
jgi:predicted PurR-regulated permease PerM